MKFIPSITLALVSITLLPSCTILLAMGVKVRPHLSENATRDDIHKRLGKPQHRQTFTPPTKLKNLPDTREEGADLPKDAKDQKIASLEEFNARGIRYQPGNISPGDLIAWYSASTFWILEPIALPFAFVNFLGSYGTSSQLSVWYSPSGQVVHTLWR